MKNKKSSVFFYLFVAFVIIGLSLSTYYTYQVFHKDNKVEIKLPLQITKIVVDDDGDLAKATENQLELATLGDLFEKELEKYEEFNLRNAKEKQEEGYFAKIVFIGAEKKIANNEGDKKGSVQFRVGAKIFPSNSFKGIEISTVAKAEKDGDMSKADWQAAASEAVALAVLRLIEFLHVNTLDSEKLIEIVKQNGMVELKKIAVERLGELREKKAVEPLLALIERKNDEERALSDLAVGALVAIGDERAVYPITRYFKLMEAEQASQVIHLVSDIPCEETRAFLSVMATGHPSIMVRMVAEEKLKSLDNAKPIAVNKTEQDKKQNGAKQ